MMSASLSDRDREILSAWMHGPTSASEIAAEVGLDVLDLTAWSARPDIAAILDSIRTFNTQRAQALVLASASAALARLVHIVEHSDDEQSARRAATAILRLQYRSQPGRGQPATPAPAHPASPHLPGFPHHPSGAQPQAPMLAARHTSGPPSPARAGDDQRGPGPQPHEPGPPMAEAVPAPDPVPFSTSSALASRGPSPHADPPHDAVIPHTAGGPPRCAAPPLAFRDFGALMHHCPRMSQPHDRPFARSPPRGCDGG